MLYSGFYYCGTPSWLLASQKKRGGGGGGGGGGGAQACKQTENLDLWRMNKSWVADLGVWASGEWVIVDCDRPLIISHDVLEQHIVVGIESGGNRMEGLQQQKSYLNLG